uniref:Joining chain of multimeric IgA and IgM n=1 Tax=Ursus americanus TaxID=9643 RepID=A0A452QYN5_URSAM
MKNHLLFWGVLAIFVKAVLVTAQDEDGRTVLVDNKCQCARITSRIIPSPEDPNEDIVERNIRIICKKCDPVEVELGNQIVIASQSNLCDEDSETCYTYDRNKCYTNRVPFTYGGQTRMVETALTPDSCYPD